MGDVTGDVTPDVTVCVSTRNRAGLLPRLVDHLERQTIGPQRFEAVIVDNGSSDDTWEVLEQLAATTSFPLTVLRNEPGKGPAAGRNRAWRAASAPLCAFTDDDCLPVDSWLEHVLAATATQEVIAAGAVRPPADQHRLLGSFTRSVWASADTAAWCATANLVVRRDDLEAVGGFDESFLNVSGEDTDLGLRVMEQGRRFTFLADAVVEHPVEMTSMTQLLRDQRRWADLVAVIARHPRARSLLLHRTVFWKASHPSFLLMVAGLLGARRRPAALALAVPWVHRRLCSHPVAETLGERIATLPGVAILDAHEVLVMAEGSLRYRTVVL